jgi:hypothetical protein
MTDAIRPFDARSTPVGSMSCYVDTSWYSPSLPSPVVSCRVRTARGRRAGAAGGSRALGEPWHVLQIVAHTMMLYPLDAAPGLLSAFNSWHGSHLWPTGRLDFTETAESAAPAARLTACIHYPLRAGIHDELLDEPLIRSLGASLEFLRAMHRVAIAGLSSESMIHRPVVVVYDVLG